MPDLVPAGVRRAAPEAARVDRYGALWIEMKAPGGGRMRRAQRWWRKRLRRAGHAHAICRSWTEARDILVSYLDGEGVPTAAERRGGGEGD